MGGYEEEIAEEREMKDRFMTRHPESPFIVGEVGGFHALRYFPIDPSYRLGARLERREHPEEATLRTNSGGELTCRHVGDLVFGLDGQSFRLRVYHAGEQVGPSVFVPFRDATCGSETYASGRYLILQLTEDDRYTLDFNLAFNPYCAYTDRFECGLPPAENDLPIPIRAGELSWSDAVVSVARPREGAGGARPTPSRRRPSGPRSARAKNTSRPPRKPPGRSKQLPAQPRRRAGRR